MICHQAWLVQTSLYFKQAGFNERYPLLADYDFLLRAILRSRVSYSHIPLSFARYEGGGVTDRYKEQMRQERRCILKTYFDPRERFFYSFRQGFARLVVHTQPVSKLLNYAPKKLRSRLAGI